jgi:hypothetical protein
MSDTDTADTPQIHRRRTSATKAMQPARDLNRTARILAAIQMRIGGYEWEEIARTLGIKGGKASAYSLVNNALKQTLREAGAELRELENMRLDALHRVYWPKALAGDGWSHDRILRQMERRAALNGTDAQVSAQAIAASLLIRTYDADTEAV